MIKGKKYDLFHKTTLVQHRVINERNFTYGTIIKIINNFLKPPKTILDIGCGSGTLALYLASKGNYVMGVDISKKAIDVCKRSTRLLGFEKTTHFSVMDFPQESINKRFEFIICSEVLEHLEDDKAALKEIFSLLKAEGYALLSVPSRNSLFFRLGLTKNFDKKVGHLRRYDLDEFLKICKNAGFMIVVSKKNEGVLRNLLFINPVAGKLIRFIKFFLVDVVTFLDGIFLKMFGESQIIVVVQKHI